MDTPSSQTWARRRRPPHLGGLQVHPHQVDHRACGNAGRRGGPKWAHCIQRAARRQGWPSAPSLPVSLPPVSCLTKVAGAHWVAGLGGVHWQGAAAGRRERACWAAGAARWQGGRPAGVCRSRAADSLSTDSAASTAQSRSSSIECRRCLLRPTASHMATPPPTPTPTPTTPPHPHTSG